MVLTGLLLGTVFGFVLQRGRFCVTGAFRYVFLTRSTRWLTAFLIVTTALVISVIAIAAYPLSFAAGASPASASPRPRPTSPRSSSPVTAAWPGTGA